ncbi:hypothetical protein AGABI2DRAFT_194475 [Agaricus bisporus var. bisporus H97]|uniref:hypothetical protein n=1 Tax=Agaricus bisporus var. bisporus (strain H97 / ATCC MYA-4626 / FGSC 10389) TaxID=936046 RepID=UPI00029F6A67|nr:hypothetical protein AGABI2DRAFT_194475 [Agaricus bisporus var. bisporus H97]EKV44406.1 hypothetical protein AGABI2DRAFT_194475 [Agaricus bisporus var. bisporus H97]
MMCKAVLVSLFWFMIATMAAPTLLEANTLLQNGEEAQALNRYFKSLKTADHCNDGQVACLGSQILAKCQGAAWTITLSQCSGSQNCYALPSVSSSGTRLTCSSEKSAEGLFAATGAVGGIFGHPAHGSMDVVNQESLQHSSNELIAASPINQPFAPSLIVQGGSIGYIAQDLQLL